VARRLTCPEDALAGEIEFALTYLLACNSGTPPSTMVMAAPMGRRRELCELMAAMITERAEKGLSGMTAEDPDLPGMLKSEGATTVDR
jgi:hypothetical protein